MGINFLHTLMAHKKGKNRKNGFVKPLILPALLCPLALSATSANLQAGYLDEIEAEAPVSTSSKVIKSNEMTDAKRLENMLKSQQPGTFVFYNKLNQENKDTVLKSFKEDEKLTHIKKQIFDLYFAQGK